MRCPFCESEHTNVSNSRVTNSGTQVWRRRKCPGCKEIFSTYENIKLSYLKVEKKDKKVVRYSRAKLYSSIYHCAVGSRRSDRGQMGELAEEVTQLFERDLVLRKVKKITSTEIVDIILRILKGEDIGTYLRFLTYFRTIRKIEDIEN